jgi:hypothetical protein
MGEFLTFTATGSPQVESRAIEEYALGQGHVTAIDRFVRRVQSRFQGAST